MADPTVTVTLTISGRPKTYQVGQRLVSERGFDRQVADLLRDVATAIEFGTLADDIRP